MSKEIGPKEKAQREMREQRFNNRNAKKVSSTDLRKTVAAVKAPKRAGKRGR